jgi:hypothetical protein
MSKQSDTANVPAAKTFAPSREDVLSTLSFFFGDPATPEKLKDYSEHHAMTYHFPGEKCTFHCIAFGILHVCFAQTLFMARTIRFAKRSTTSSSTRRKSGRRAWLCHLSRLMGPPSSGMCALIVIRPLIVECVL